MDHRLQRSRHGPVRSLRWLVAGAAFALAGLSGLTPAAPAAPASADPDKTYRNPLPVTTSTGAQVETCADPTVIRGARQQDRPANSPTDHRWWYMYCTADPLNEEDRNQDDTDYNYRTLPMFRSRDLINWRYMGDALTSPPAYADPGAGLWAPEVEYFGGQYHLYFTVTDTNINESPDPNAFERAIGHATSAGPLGPWTIASQPAVEPHPNPCCGPDSRRDVFDPEVFTDPADGQRYIYYGSYFGGVAVRELSADGFTSDPASQVEVGIANKYEAPEIVKRGSYYYLMMSATDCCRGPLAGYSVYVGRSTSPTGPFVDKDGVSLGDEERMDDPTNGRAGGTPFLSMNGNRWVGPGHHSVFVDRDGQWWTIYHAIDRTDPYFERGVDIFGGNCSAEGQDSQPCGDLNKRPALLDPIYWDSNGWPNVRAGRWASDETMPGPAAQPDQDSRYVAYSPWRSRPGNLISSRSTEFNGSTLPSQFSWIREPQGEENEGAETEVANGQFRFRTQNGDIYVNENNAPLLVENAPAGDFVVETRVKLEVPAEGCCFNFRQAGIVIYGNDDNFVKLTHTSIFNTRQTEWAKEQAPVPDGYPRYGNTVVGAPGEWTYLRIIRTESPGGVEYYQAYTRTDGNTWTRGGTWTHRLTEEEGPVRIGLISAGCCGPFSDPNLEVEAYFDYLRVYTLEVRGPIRLS